MITKKTKKNIKKRSQHGAEKHEKSIQKTKHFLRVPKNYFLRPRGSFRTPPSRRIDFFGSFWTPPRILGGPQNRPKIDQVTPKVMKKANPALPKRPPKPARLPNLIFNDFSCFLGASWPHFSCIFMIFALIFDPNIVNPGRRPRKRNMPKIYRDLPRIY